MGAKTNMVLCASCLEHVEVGEDIPQVCPHCGAPFVAEGEERELASVVEGKGSRLAAALGALATRIRGGRAKEPVEPITNEIYGAPPIEDRLLDPGPNAPEPSSDLGMMTSVYGGPPVDLGIKKAKIRVVDEEGEEE